jgi:hypothetical protein
VSRFLQILTILSGLVMISLGGVLMFINPLEAGQLPDGMFTPVIALEFVQDAVQLRQIMNVDDVEGLLHAFLYGNEMDHFFMVAYSIFALLTGLLIFLKARVWAVLICIPLSAMMLTGDVMENFHIAVLLDFYPKGADVSVYEWLRFYTWLKWGSIAALMFLFSMYFLQEKWWMKLLGLPLLCTFFTAVAAWFFGGIWLEIMVISVFISFLMLFVYSLIYRKVG